MALTIKIKRATRAQLNTAASANGLLQGEPYLITDENRIAVGLSVSTYEVYEKEWKETTVNLASAGWSTNTQSETISGLTASSDVMVFPPIDRTAFVNYGSAQISATAIGTNSITFTCTTTPVADINNVIVLWR